MPSGRIGEHICAGTKKSILSGKFELHELDYRKMIQLLLRFSSSWVSRSLWSKNAIIAKLPTTKRTATWLSVYRVQKNDTQKVYYLVAR